MGFGADQVILVRDEAVRKEISSYIGHQALILTIVECKGLEFQVSYALCTSLLAMYLFLVQHYAMLLEFIFILLFS